MQAFSTKIATLLCAILVCFPYTVEAENRTVPESKQQIMLSFAPLVKKAEPAVVNIYTARNVGNSPFAGHPFFEKFFGKEYYENQENKPKFNSLGSGVIVRPEGLMVTNFHVIKGSDEIKAVLSDRREFDAKIILTDEKTDLAVLKLETKDEKLPYIEIEDSDSLEVGDIVLAIGNPFGIGQTVTSGIISALARTTVGVSDYEFFIQTDASINPGNSGGALINIEGKLVGINSAIFTRTGDSSGIGFAIPSNMVNKVVSSVFAGNRVIRPWIGITLETVTQDIAKAVGLKTPKGARIRGVYKGSPAEEAGLQPGDVIVQIDDHEIIDTQSLRYRIATFEIGKNAVFHVLRTGNALTVPITMQPAPENPPRDLSDIEPGTPLSGARVANLSPAVAEELGIGQYSGVVIVELEPRSVAWRFFEERDIVEEVNGAKVNSVRELKKLLYEADKGWVITAKRRDKHITLRIAP